MEGSPGGGGPTKRRRCVFVCVPAGQQRAPAVWIPPSPDSHLSLSPQTIWALSSVLSPHIHEPRTDGSCWWQRWRRRLGGQQMPVSLHPFSFCQPILSSPRSNFHEFPHLVLFASITLLQQTQFKLCALKETPTTKKKKHWCIRDVIFTQAQQFIRDQQIPWCNMWRRSS